jgi:hypothetical protein
MIYFFKKIKQIIKHNSKINRNNKKRIHGTIATSIKGNVTVHFHGIATFSRQVRQSSKMHEVVAFAYTRGRSTTQDGYIQLFNQFNKYFIKLLACLQPGSKPNAAFWRKMMRVSVSYEPFFSPSISFLL